MRHDEVGIDARLRLDTEVVLHHLAHERHARGATDEDHAVELRRSDARDAHRLVAHRERSLDERTRELLERGARETEREIERLPRVAVRELFDAEVHLRLTGQLTLRPLRCGAQALVGLRVVARIEAVVIEEGARHLLGDEHVDVVAAEERVARSRHDLEHVARELEDRHVERAAAEVVHRDALTPRARRAVARAAIAVRERRGRGLVEDAHHLEPRDLARGLRRRALQLVEVRGHGDHRAVALLTDGLLGDASHLAQHERADLGERVRLVARAHLHAPVRTLDELEREALSRAHHLGRVVRTPDQALHRVDGVLRVQQSSLARGIPDQHVALRMERDHRRNEPVSLRVHEHLHPRAVRDGDDGVGGAQIDSEDGRRGHRGLGILQKHDRFRDRQLSLSPDALSTGGFSAMRASSSSIQRFTCARNGHIHRYAAEVN